MHNLSAVGFSSLSAVGGVLQGFTPVGDGVPCPIKLKCFYLYK